MGNPEKAMLQDIPPGTADRQPDALWPINGTGSSSSSGDLKSWPVRAWMWYYHHFLRGFCYYLLLLVMFLLPLGLMVNALASQFGPRHLFFHEEPLKELIVGISLALFWAEILFVSYLLWLRDLRQARLPSAAEGQSRQPGKTKGDSARCAPPMGFLAYFIAILSCISITGLIFVVVIELVRTFADILSESVVPVAE